MNLQKIQSSLKLKCIKTVVRDGHEFVAGKTYFVWTINSENSNIIVNKGGGGVVPFTENEFNDFFIKVILIKCKESIKQEDITIFGKGHTYYIGAGKKDDEFIIYVGNVTSFFTYSINDLEKFFEIVPE